jgi:hypothetical protein
MRNLVRVFPLFAAPAPRSIRLLALWAALGGCAGDPPPPQRQEPETAVSVDTSPEPVEPPPRPAQTKIGLMPLLRSAPSEGSCRSTGSPAEPRWAYEGDEVPKRVLVVGEGAASRTFAPTFLELRASQTAGAGVTEVETLFVLFGPDGRIETGTRQFFNTAAPPARESAGLLASDSAAVRDLALYVLQKCRPRPA